MYLVGATLYDCESVWMSYPALPHLPCHEVRWSPSSAHEAGTVNSPRSAITVETDGHLLHSPTIAACPHAFQ